MNTSIRDWRPKLWSEFIGSHNQRQIELLRHERLRGICPKPLLIIGPTGCGKTTFGRHLIASHCCPNAISNQGNSCGYCLECQSQGPDFNGNGSRFRHYEIDCTSLATRADISDWLEVCLCEENVACFWDEAHRLGDNDRIEMLLKPVEQFRGIFILAMTHDRASTINSAMRDRLRHVRLSRPTLSEFVDFLEFKVSQWNIDTSRDIINRLVNYSSHSFRECLDKLQLAVHVNNGKLDIAFLESVYEPQPSGLAQYE